MIISVAKKSEVEQLKRLLNPNAQRIRAIFAALPIPDDRRDRIDGEVSFLCFKIGFAALNDNPKARRRAGSAGTLRQLDRLDKNAWRRLVDIGNLGLEAHAALEPDFRVDEIGSRLIRFSKEIRQERDRVAAAPVTPPQKGRNIDTLVAAITDAAANTYANLTGQPATRIVDVETFEVKDKDFALVLRQIFEELGLKASVDNRSKGHGDKGRR